MMKNKKVHKPVQYQKRMWISAVLALICFVLYVLLGFHVFSISENQTVETVILALTLVLSFVGFGYALLSFVRWKRSSNLIRFSYATFSLVKNIKSEKSFLYEVDKDIKQKKQKEDLLIAFSVTRFKKTVFTRYGYEKGAEVLEIVYSAFNPLAGMYANANYGYDYNENFLIYLSNTDLDGAKRYIADLTAEINKRLAESNNEVKFISDFGLSFSRNDNNELINAKSMLQRALIAADHGRIDSELGGLTVYDAKMFEKNKRNVQLGLEIEKGLESSQFELHFQPKFDLKLGRFGGAEALVRWRHPELGLLSPANFILFAEQSDLIIKLDHYVLEKVCAQLDEWRGRGQRLLPISVNISKRTLFTGNIVNYISAVTEKYNINPMLIEIEIVESPSLQDILLLLSIVKKFKNLKIKVAIDDFGTGYSSLSYIKKIPFDVIKIDKAFLDDVDIDQKSRLVLKNIVDLAHILDAYVVMEGVQDEKQVKMLEGMGADAIQGFFYSRPLPADQYQLFLEDNLFEYKAKGRKKKG